MWAFLIPLVEKLTVSVAPSVLSWLGDEALRVITGRVNAENAARAAQAQSAAALKSETAIAQAEAAARQDRRRRRCASRGAFDMKITCTRNRGARGEAHLRETPCGNDLLRANARNRSLRDKTSIPRRVLRACACAISLAGCSTAAAPVAPPQCLPLTSWTAVQQDQMRKEYDGLPKDAILRAVFMDWVGMRDADRVCQSAGGK